MNAFFQLPTYVLFVIIFFLILLFNHTGFRYKRNLIEKYPERVNENIGSMQGSMLGLMSLLLGFTFSVAMSKFETRRHLLVEEANTIGTAILRTDLYPDSLRLPLRAQFKDYLETRIAYYHAGNNEHKIEEILENSEKISTGIWKTVANHARDSIYRLRSQQMIPIVNAMIDIIASRDASRINKVPALVLWTLLILVLTAAFLLGSDYKGHKRNLMLLFGYALVMTLTLNLITELNHPREGFINLDGAEKKVEDLRKLF